MQLKKNSVPVSVTYFVPCEDKDNDAFGSRGRYVTEQGIVRQVTAQFLRLGEKKIALKTVLCLESDFEIDGRLIFADPCW